VAERSGWTAKALDNLVPPGHPVKISLITDTDIPAGTMEMRSNGSRLRLVLADVAEEMISKRSGTDRAYAEELRSLAESAGYVTYPGEMTVPEKCEACGTPVTFITEAPIGYPQGDQKMETGLWEPDDWRRHTPRRCAAMRKDFLGG
jgi:hypothetical protein